MELFFRRQKLAHEPHNEKNNIAILNLLTTWTLLCKLPANEEFSGCFLSAFLAAFFALFSRKRFCSITVSTLCCSQAPVNDWSNRGTLSVWCWRYCPIRFFNRSIPLLLSFDISDGACCYREENNQKKKKKTTYSKIKLNKSAILSTTINQKN